MSTYLVSSSPSQIVLGANTTNTSLINSGPSTIYLGSDPSVSSLTGMPLYPTGQMSWNAETPLWAVCANGFSSVLSTHIAAGTIDVSRAKFNILLGQANVGGNNSTIDTGKIETGFCETITLFIRETNSVENPPDTGQLVVQWYDSNLNSFIAEIFYPENILCSSVLGFQFRAIQIPVKGAYVDLSFTASDLTNTKIWNWQLFGTDRKLNAKMWSGITQGTGPFQYFPQYVNCVAAGTIIMGGNPAIDTWQIKLASPYTNDILLAAVGSRAGIFIQSGSITVAGNISLASPFSMGTPFARYGFVQTLNTGGQNIYQEQIMPVGMPLRLVIGGGLSGGTVGVSITWQDLG